MLLEIILPTKKFSFSGAIPPMAFKDHTVGLVLMLAIYMPIEVVLRAEPIFP